MRTLAIAAAALAALLCAVPAGAAPARPGSAEALFERAHPFDPSGCIVLKLALRVDSTTASVDYWGENTCSGTELGHLQGVSSLWPGQFTMSGLETATLSGAVVDVVGLGIVLPLRLDATWSASGRPSVSPPRGGSGSVIRSVPASVTGTVVDIALNTLFTGAHATGGELAEVLALLPR